MRQTRDDIGDNLSSSGIGSEVVGLLPATCLGRWLIRAFDPVIHWANCNETVQKDRLLFAELQRDCSKRQAVRPSRNASLQGHTTVILTHMVTYIIIEC